MKKWCRCELVQPMAVWTCSWSLSSVSSNTWMRRQITGSVPRSVILNWNRRRDVGGRDPFLHHRRRAIGWDVRNQSLLERSALHRHRLLADVDHKPVRILQGPNQRVALPTAWEGPAVIELVDLQ